MAVVARPIVVGVFEKREKAEEAIEDLRRAGYSDQEIGFLYRRMDEEDEEKKTSTEAAIGVAAGAVGGGVLSGILTAAAISAIPGIGPAVAGGIIFATLGGAALGAMAGGFVGMLVSLGVPEDDAHYYQGELEHGRTIVTVKSDAHYEEARTLLKQHGAYDATERPALPESDGFNDADTEEAIPAVEDVDTVKVERYRPAQK